MATSTSFRISDKSRQRLTSYAGSRGVSATSVLERLIIESLDALEFPGIVYRGLDGDRRAALAAGPDVWEVVARLRELPGAEESRVELLSQETGLHARQVRVALDYAAAHPEDITVRIDRNSAAAEESERRARTRESLLA